MTILAVCLLASSQLTSHSFVLATSQYNPYHDIMTPNPEGNQESSCPSEGPNQPFVQPESFNQNFLTNQQQNLHFSKASDSGISTTSSSSVQGLQFPIQLLFEPPNCLLRDVFPDFPTVQNPNSLHVNLEQFQAQQQLHPQNHQSQPHPRPLKKEYSPNNRQQNLLNKRALDLNYYNSFLLSESQANCVDLSDSEKQLSVEYCAESVSGRCFGVNVEGAMVEVVELQNTLSSTKATPKRDVSPRKSSDVANSCTSQPSPLSCVSTEVVLQKSCSPNTPLLSTDGVFRRPGWGKRRSLSSLPRARMKDLQHPVVRVDELVEYCKNELHKKGIQKDYTRDQELYHQMLKRLDDATVTNKSCERQKLKSTFAQTNPTGVKPSRMEARLSRYKNDVYIILVQNEIKRIAENFSVLKEFVETHSSESGQNSQISPGTKPGSDDIFRHAVSSDERTSMKKRKLE